MSGIHRGLVTVAVAAGSVVAGVAPAYASGSLQDCLDQGGDHLGGPPTCTEVNGKWVASWPNDPGSAGGGIPSGFIMLFLLFLAVAVAITVWKVATAQKLARQSGLDPRVATQMTLLTENGLDATYLAASLHQQPAAVDPATSPAGKSTAARLTELGSLRDQGLITQAEHDERRRAIIDEV